MSSFLNKAKSIILGPEFDEDEEFYDEYEEEIIDSKPDISTSKFSKRNNTTSNNQNSSSKVVNIHPSLKMEVVRTYPEVVADAFGICDYIRENKVCIVNLEGVDNKEAQRIADFLGGVAYSLNGDIQRISKGVFIIAPTTVEITGQLKEELRENGVIFPWISSVLK